MAQFMAGMGRSKGVTPGVPTKGRLALIIIGVLGALAVAGVFLFGGPSTTLEVTRSDAAASEGGQEPAPETTEEAEGGQGAGETVPTAQGSTVQAPPTSLTVHVDGAVASPGVYSISLADARVTNAIDAAGGLTEDADTSQLNLAQPLEDAMKVHVPRQGEEVQAPAATTTSPSSVTSSASSSGGLININTATVEELQSLSGVGEATAKAIVQDREEHGAFTSIEDLMRVSGIGEKKFAKLQGSICV